jgi:predicted transcriptional regulator of viral defense system
MKLIEIQKIDKLYFGHEEIARVLGISEASSRVTASRYAKKGLLLRIKKNMYVLRERWIAAEKEEKFMLANLAQTPSYISLATALDFYELTTQMQRNFFESVALKRTKRINVKGDIFRYTRITNRLYQGFKKEKGVFIATPEKALLDAIYLMSYGRYALDMSAIDPKKVDENELMRLSREFPARTCYLLKRYGYLSAA